MISAAILWLIGVVTPTARAANACALALIVARGYMVLVATIPNWLALGQLAGVGRHPNPPGALDLADRPPHRFTIS